MLTITITFSLFRTVLEFASPNAVFTSGAATFFYALKRFCLMFFASAAIGIVIGLLSAIVSFHNGNIFVKYNWVKILIKVL